MPETQPDPFAQLWGKIVAQAWEDEEFKRRLFDDPVGVCQEHGATLPDGFDVKVIDDDQKTMFLPFPESSDAALPEGDDQLIKAWNKAVTLAWDDEELKTRLFSNPAAVLQEQGARLPADKKLEVLANGDTSLFLPFPPPPAPDGELSDDDLDAVAGGASGAYSTSRFQDDLRPLHNVKGTIAFTSGWPPPAPIPIAGPG